MKNVYSYFLDGKSPATDIRKSACRAAVNKAVALGKLPKLDGKIRCVDCDKPAFCYDHRDYGKPLKVDPVCKRCDALRGPAKVPKSWGYQPVGRQQHRILPGWAAKLPVATIKKRVKTRAQLLAQWRKRRQILAKEKERAK